MFDTQMPQRRISRRRLVTIAALSLLAGCRMIPNGPKAAPPPPPAPGPSAALPVDQSRHRVALLVPLTGANAQVGMSLQNAANMALIDTNATNLRITAYDTGAGAAAAASKAIAEGNKLILGPLQSEDLAAITPEARNAKVPVIAFSSDPRVAAPGAVIMGMVPEQSIARTVRHARGSGVARFAALIPEGEYGARLQKAFANAVMQGGGTVVSTESYARSAGAVVAAARKLKLRGGYQAVLIADSGHIATQAAPVLKGPGGPAVRLLGTELWTGDSSVTASKALAGAWYSALSNARYPQFADSYKTRFGSQPYRISTLGYDAVLLTIRIAREWKPGTPFPTARLNDNGGFLGLDGPFRFGDNGVVERAFEVDEVRATGVAVVSPAPGRFQD